MTLKCHCARFVLDHEQEMANAQLPSSLSENQK